MLVASFIAVSCVQDDDFSVPVSVGNEQEPVMTGSAVTFNAVKKDLNSQEALQHLPKMKIFILPDMWCLMISQVTSLKS